MLKLYLELEIKDFLHQSFKRELEELRSKYTVKDEDKIKLNRLADIIKDVGSSAYELPIDEALDLVQEPVEVIEFYIWLKEYLEVNSISHTKELLRKLEKW